MCRCVCVCGEGGGGAATNSFIARGMLLALRVTPYKNTLLMAVFIVIKFSLIPLIS